MTNLLIIHGTGGNPGENWLPWLKMEFEKMGYRAHVPQFPTPEGQSLKNWMRVFDGYKKYINEKTILIGHSLGAAFLLCILESLDRPVNASFLVAGFTGLINNPEFDRLNRTFAVWALDWQKIENNCPKFFIISSDNDPYVSVKKAFELGEKLNVKPTILKNAGHINKDSGFERFDYLLE